MAGSDVTMSTAWRTHRQALRDVPSQEGFQYSNMANQTILTTT